MKETLTVLLEDFQEVDAHLFKRLDINDFSLLIDLIMHLALVCIKCLSFLLMLIKPFPRLWFLHWLRKRQNLLQGLFDFVWQPW
jgi:hypothetical protein